MMLAALELYPQVGCFGLLGKLPSSLVTIWQRERGDNMRRILLGLVGSLLLIAGIAEACGDKFPPFGRVQWKARTWRPASLLTYARPEAFGAATLNDPTFQATLQKAGHKLRIVRSEEELRVALKSEKYDVLIADLSSAPSVEGILAGASEKPVLLPLVHHGSKADVRSANHGYQCVMKTPDKGDSYLSAIDKALALKRKSNPATSQR